MSFEVAAAAYDRFMGRYSVLLASQLVELAGIEPGQQVLDVGCGPGALIAELVPRLGHEAVSAVDPSVAFVAAARERHPGVVVEQAPAERLPFADGRFDAALAQLVVQFMRSPVDGLREMARVTREGGVVAASVWDLAGGRAPLSVFWAAARSVDPDTRGEAAFSGSREGELGELFAAAGLNEIEEREQIVELAYETFDDWWEPYTLGVGPAGDHVAKLDPEGCERVRSACRALLPEAPFSIEATAWAVRGLA